MCVMSMVHEFNNTYIPQQVWTTPMLDDYKKIIEKLEEIDRKLELAECDPDKAKYIKKIEKRLKALEKAQKVQV